MLKELLKKESIFDGNTVKQSKLAEIWPKLEDANPIDLATEMSELPPQQLLALFRSMPKGLAAEVFTYLSREIHKDLFHNLSHSETAELLEQMYVDDAVDAVQEFELPSNIVRKLIALVKDKTQRDFINRFLQFPKDSAGSIMTVEFVCLFGTMTCEEALQYIRKHGVERVLFGTDSPWNPLDSAVREVTSTSLSEAEKRQIFWDNAAKLWHLPELEP